MLGLGLVRRAGFPKSEGKRSTRSTKLNELLYWPMSYLVFLFNSFCFVTLQFQASFTINLMRIVRKLIDFEEDPMNFLKLLARESLAW